MPLIYSYVKHSRLSSRQTGGHTFAENWLSPNPRGYQLSHRNFQHLFILCFDRNRCHFISDSSLSLDNEPGEGDRFIRVLSGMFTVLIMVQLLEEYRENFCWINSTVGKIKGQWFNQGCTCAECATRHIGFSDLVVEKVSFICEKRRQLSSEGESHPSFILPADWSCWLPLL